MLRKITYILLSLYAILILYTIIGRYFGQGYQPIFTPLLTLLAFIFAILHASQFMGWRRASVLLGTTFSISLLFECVGVATGFVYGPYHYTEKLGIKFLNLVPLLIPITWFMMSYPAFVIAVQILKPRQKIWVWRLAVATVGALVMTAWDLAMDPLMVAGGHWIWEVQGGYFGIPVQNFWGWWLTVFVSFSVFLWLINLTPGFLDPARSQGKLFIQLAVLSYAITGFSTVITNFQAGLTGPGLVGLFSMGPWIIYTWITEENNG